MISPDTARIVVKPATATPFLSIITPCYKRPVALARNRESILAQGRDDIEQILVIDDVGRGWAWVAREVAKATEHTHGQYIMGLDDDDELAGAEVVTELKAELDRLPVAPEVLVTYCEVQHSSGQRVIVPEAPFWGGTPVKGHISGQCVILRRDVRMLHLKDFIADDDGMVIDYPWMSAVFTCGRPYTVAWIPMLFSRMQSRGLGRPEAA